MTFWESASSTQRCARPSNAWLERDVFLSASARAVPKPHCGRGFAFVRGLVAIGEGLGFGALSLPLSTKRATTRFRFFMQSLTRFHLNTQSKKVVATLVASAVLALAGIVVAAKIKVVSVVATAGILNPDHHSLVLGLVRTL